MRGFLTDRDWLAGKGGCSSWGFADDDEREWFQLSESEQKLYRDTAFSYVIKVVCAGSALYIDPQGYNYARYVAFELAAAPQPERSREEIRREEMKSAAARRLEETKQRIANPPTVPDDHGLRFLWNGIKSEGKLNRAYYSIGNLVEPWPAETITVWARDYNRFPGAVTRYFDVENNTDSQSDYFEEDRLRVCPNHPLYAVVKAALDAQKIHEDKRAAKRAQKWGSIDA